MFRTQSVRFRWTIISRTHEKGQLLPLRETVMKILAVDPATRCGWAHSDGISGTWDLSVRRDESAGMRLIRMTGKLREIHQSCGIDVLVYEAARHAAPKMQGALVVQATMQGVIIHWCEEHGVEYRGYSPTEIKRHATGSGRANKADMIAAAVARVGHAIDDNQADALWLLDLARTELQGSA